MKRLILLFILSMLITQSYAQASGGQIRRKVNTTSKTNHAKRDRTSDVKSNNSVETPSTVPIIQPTPISGFFTYNVVVGTMSILANASRFCQTLRDQGYTSLIYQDNRSGTVYYRITIGSSNNEQEALRIRDQARITYPDAWILYFVNGKQERYF